MLRIQLFFCLILISSFSSGQDIMRKSYDAEDNLTDEQNGHYYIQHKQIYKDVDTIRSFYSKSGKVRSIEQVNELGNQEGSSIFYHENGVVKIKASFEKGFVSGDVRSWYPDGKSQSIEFFLAEKASGSVGNSVLVDYWDSLGNQMIIKGTGFCKCVFNILSNSKKILEEGKLIEGTRDSVWIGYHNNGLKYFEEIYSKGELQSGQSFDKSGNQYFYKSVEEMAVLGETFNNFYEHVGKTLQYPKEARRKRIQGKVFVEFVIDRDGSVTNVKAIRGIGHGCDEEAIKAVKSSPPWSPGRQRGQPVRQRMVLPIDFKIG
jgi:TonB family protein